MEQILVTGGWLLILSVPGARSLEVDYRRSLEAMIADARLDWWDGNITSTRFPIAGKGVVVFESCYFHPRYEISLEDAARTIVLADKKRSWSPAAIEYLLPHGKVFPDEQRKFRIFSPGSITQIGSESFVPCLDACGDDRGLTLHPASQKFDLSHRLLAFRPLVPP